VALLGAFLFWRGRFERTRWFLWAAVVTSFFPFVISAAGWSLTEFGRQPWIVHGLLKTADANSPSVSAWTIGLSLGAFICLYLALLVLDFWLMSRYARVDPPEPSEAAGAQPVPAVSY
jgi:cytochrome d ubiquinol oxidase subunit I